MVFLQSSEVKRYNPIYFCGLWLTSRSQQFPVHICGAWLWQYIAAALRDSTESDGLIFFGSQAIWLRLLALKAAAPDALEEG